MRGCNIKEFIFIFRIFLGFYVVFIKERGESLEKAFFRVIFGIVLGEIVVIVGKVCVKGC